MPKIEYTLMPDYQCEPLWSGSGNIDPKTLPITKKLQDGLKAWSNTFESATNQGQTGFSSSKEKTNFEKQGKSLKKSLQAELGQDYKVRYKP